MAQETTTAKRCETCGRIGACIKLRRDKITDMRGMKMEDTPGYCDSWVDGKKFLFEIPGCVYQAERGTALNIYEKNQDTGEWKIAGGETPPDASGQHQSQAGETETLPATAARQPIDFKALDKVLDATKSRDLAKIEARIDIAKQQTMGALLEIGRCLNEAKDRNLVQHGQWEQWAAEQTGMGERTRQRIMQAAREVPAGSAMERLDFTKTMTLLALPEGDREAAAEKAEAENTPLRKLQEQVKELNGKLKKAQDDARWQKDRDQRILDNKEQKIKELAAMAVGAEQARLELHKASHALDAQTTATNQALERVRELENGAAPTATGEAATSAQGISPEAQAIIDRLMDEKKQAEQYAEDQAALRQDAQEEMLRLKSRVTTGAASGAERLSGEGFAEAVRVFMGSAGVLPHMGPLLMKMDSRERQAFQGGVTILRGWVLGAMQALDMVAGEGTVREA